MKARPSMAHDATPDAFAQAMLLCRGYAPSCSDAGECAHDGDCLSANPTDLRTLAETVAALAKDVAEIKAAISRNPAQ